MSRKVRKHGTREVRITHHGDRATFAWLDSKPYLLDIEEIAR